MDKAAQPPFSAELLEQLIGPVTPAELEGIFQQFKKSVLERALGAEMRHHLGYAPAQAKPEGSSANHRNDKVIPFFAFPPEVRRVIYTTNAIESVNARLRKIIKTRGHFPSDDAATRLIWLARRNITADWGRAANHWKSAMNQFAILYEDRFTKSGL